MSLLECEQICVFIIGGVDPATPTDADPFEDPRAVTGDDPHPDEDRYVTVGSDFLGRVLVVS